MKQTIFSTIILLTVSGCAVSLPEDELSSTRNKLEHFLQNAEMTQSEMNIISANVLQLANMEKALLEYRIENQPNFSKIEKAFNTDREAWEKRVKKEASKPSPYEGGSFAALDHNSKMTDCVKKRIAELKTKWRTK